MYVSLNLLVFPPMHTHFRLHHLLLALTCLHILSWKSLCRAIAGFMLHRFVATARGWRHHPGLHDEMLNASFHFVGLAAICWALWRTRNNICFDKKVVRSPTEIICLASSIFLGRTVLKCSERRLSTSIRVKHKLRTPAWSCHAEKEENETQSGVAFGFQSW